MHPVVLAREDRWGGAPANVRVLTFAARGKAARGLALERALARSLPQADAALVHMVPTFLTLAAPRLGVVLMFLVAMFGAAGAWAQAYPAKPVKLIVGFPPGGGSDALARLVAAALTEKFGQQIIVDNKAGANTIVATRPR